MRHGVRGWRGPVRLSPEGLTGYQGGQGVLGRFNSTRTSTSTGTLPAGWRLCRNLTRSTLVSSAMSSEAAIVLLGCAVFFPVLLGVYRRREGIRHRLRGVILVEITYLLVGLLLLNLGLSPAVAILAGVVSGLLVDRSTPTRSRYIPQSERRKAIARWELKTGRKFNPRLYHVDHIVPFAKGGSSTADNLQVLERRKNLSKGAKSPWWDLLGR
jgi:hypothetical protein